MKSLPKLATMLALAAPMPAQAGDPPVQTFEPSTSWTLDYGAEQCTLMRDFGPEDKRLRLQVESYGSLVDFRMLLAGKPVPNSRAASGKVRYSFVNDPEQRETMALEGTSGPGIAAVSFDVEFAPYEPHPDYSRLRASELVALAGQPKQPAPDFERRATGITVEIGSRARLKLDLGRMEGPLRAMRACVENLQRSWGLDPAMQNHLSKFPVPDVSTVRRVQSNYPPSMVMEGRSAFVPVRLMVDAAGAVTDCVVQVPGIESDFRTAVCNNLARRFSPALDGGGAPVAAMYRSSVIYVLSR